MLPNVALADENPGVVDGLCESSLEDAGLKAAFHELFDGESEDEIEALLAFAEKSQTSKTAEKSSTLEHANGVLFGLGQQNTSDGAHLGQDKHNSPDLALVLETELTAKLEFLCETLLLVRPARSFGGLAVYVVVPTHAACLNKKIKNEISRNRLSHIKNNRTKNFSWSFGGCKMLKRGRRKRGLGPARSNPLSLRL